MRSFFVFLLLIIGVHNLKAQNFLDTLNSSLTKYYTYYPQEKIYIQFNKQSYNAGNELWFKAYLTSDGKESTLSKIMYAELFDKDGIILKKIVLPVNNGTASGNFKLPDDLHATYYLRAYTNWMLNFHAQFLFYKKIIVGDTAVADNSKSQNFFADFYPEGGLLVKGLVSKIVCNVFDENGLPIKATGKIVNDAGAVMANIATNDEGFAEFMMRVDGSIHSYKAIIQSQTGMKKTFSLPDAQDEGIVLYVQNDFNNAGNQLGFRISRSVTHKNKYQHLLICSQLNDRLQLNEINFDNDYAGNNDDDTSVTSLSPLTLDSFPSGILHISVFNANTGQLLSERLMNYNDGKQNMIATIHADTVNFLRNGYNAFTIETPTAIKGNLAVSVTADSNNLNKISSNFLSNMLLTSNFKTYIHNPAFYYANNDIQTQQALDNLLITKKWQQFTWSKILQDSFPVITHAPEQSLGFSGKVYQTKYGKTSAFAKSDFILEMKTAEDSSITLYNIKTDSAGHFNLNSLDFNNMAYFYIQNDHYGNKLTLHADTYYTDSMYAKDFYDKETPASYDSASDTIAYKPIYPHNQVFDTSGTTLPSVKVKTRVKSHTDSTIAHFCDGPFIASEAIKTFDFTDDSIKAFDNENVLQFLQTRIPGLVISGNTSGAGPLPTIYWRLLPSLSGNLSYSGQSPEFFFNEGMLNEGTVNFEMMVNILTMTKISEVALIRAYEPGHFAAATGNAPHGAIAVYLKDGTETRYTAAFASGLVKNGYSERNDFINTPDSVSGNDPQALYWNPNITEDSVTHSSKIYFYNTSGAKQYKIIVEGIDENGNVISREAVFKQP